MQPMNLTELARRVAGRAYGEARIERVSTDSRAVAAGDLFVALSGPNFDGHDFVNAAAGDGAAAALVMRDGQWSVPHVRVDDTLRALGALAQSVRRDLPVRVVGVTGSNGKTTVKEMIAAILRRAGPTLATQGNLNNEIGLPQTLLRLEPEHRFGVIEMGASARGEIERLAAIAAPQVGVVTNAGAAHLEGFGGYEGVALGKGELFAGLDADGIAVINADDRYAPLWREQANGRRVIDFGLQHPAAVRARTLADGRHRLVTPAGEADLALALPGTHNLMNALAACAAALAQDIALADIVAGLESMEAVHGRLNWRAARRGAKVLDDTYNANPTSLRAALDVLRDEHGGDRWLVLGDMAELGADALVLHRQAAGWAREAGVSRLFAVGELAAATAQEFGGGGRHFDDRAILAEALNNELDRDVAVLVKGSRSMAMEQVVAALCPPPEDNG